MNTEIIENENILNILANDNYNGAIMVLIFILVAIIIDLSLNKDKNE